VRFCVFLNASYFTQLILVNIACFKWFYLLDRFFFNISVSDCRTPLYFYLPALYWGGFSYEKENNRSINGLQNPYCWWWRSI